MTTRISDVDSNWESAELSGESPYGFYYCTTADEKALKFKSWGSYFEIWLLDEPYFAGYYPGETPDENWLYTTSLCHNPMSHCLLSKVLIDNDNETKLLTGSSLKLLEGYELVFKGVDTDGKRLFLELRKNGQMAKTQVILPSVNEDSISEKTFYFNKVINSIEPDDELCEIPIIAVHFKRVYSQGDKDTALIDGIFQISETPKSIMPGLRFDAMCIRTVDATAETVTMDNKDKTLLLERGVDVQLMGDIYLKTMYNDISDTKIEPLKYFIYSIQENIV